MANEIGSTNVLVVLAYGVWGTTNSDVHQSIKRQIVTERLPEIYTQMRIHVIGCV